MKNSEKEKHLTHHDEHEQHGKKHKGISATVKALKQSVLFQHLPEDSLRSVAGVAKMRQYFPDEVIVWQGNPSDSLYLITNGIVAVKRIISAEKEHLLAYLLPGNTFGEVGILENQPRSASVVSVSDVDVLVIRRKDFMDILHKFPTVAIELAKILGKYLLDTNRRLARGNKKAKLILFFSAVRGSGGTTIGNLFAREIATLTNKTTAYTEYPSPRELVADLNIDKKTKIFKHPCGYDILVSLEDNFLSPSARSMLMIDAMMNDYDNNIICINDPYDENLMPFLDFANQIVIISPPTREGLRAMHDLQKRLKKHIRPNETNVFTLLNHKLSEENFDYSRESFDFEVPYNNAYPHIQDAEFETWELTPEIKALFGTLIDRLERTNQISVFIPTTLDVDKQVDTTPYVEKTLKFLAERFGGATSKEAQGVWNSEEVGLVGETVYIVQSFATQNDINQHLDSVIDYIKKLKIELRQEAMALEINNKLSLI
jgi:CRP-like cAMP-binding protein